MSYCLTTSSASCTFTSSALTQLTCLSFQRWGSARNNARYSSYRGSETCGFWLPGAVPGCLNRACGSSQPQTFAGCRQAARPPTLWWEMVQSPCSPPGEGQEVNPRRCGMSSAWRGCHGVRVKMSVVGPLGRGCEWDWQEQRQEAVLGSA